MDRGTSDAHPSTNGSGRLIVSNHKRSERVLPAWYARRVFLPLHFTDHVKRSQIEEERDFPRSSKYAYLVLDGHMLDDDRGGSYHVKRSLVKRIAARYGLSTVNVQGSLFWSDDVRVQCQELSGLD